MKAPIFLLCLLAVMATSNSAFAYRRMTCNGKTLKWSTTSITMEVESFLKNDQFYGPQTTDGLSQFNKNSSRFFVGTIEHPTSYAPADNNTHSEISTSVANAPSGGRTVPVSNCATSLFTEMDVYVNPNKVTSSIAKTSLIAYGLLTQQQLYSNVLAHELGHVAGLDHTADDYSLMGTSFRFLHTNGANVSVYVGADANHGMQDTYGTFATTDVSVSHWKYDSLSGPINVPGQLPYAPHMRVQIFPAGSTGNVAVGTDSDNVNNTEATQQFLLSKGGQYDAEFNFENNGTSAQTFTVNYYSSPNDVITTEDTLLATRTVTLAAASHALVRQTVNIARNSKSGRSFYIGAVVDPSNQLAENDEYNATYIPCQISTTQIVALRARVNNKYVQVGNGGSAPLIAAGPAVSTWERFELVPNFEDGTVSLLALNNDRFVVAESQGSSSLIANREVIGQWEKFLRTNNSDGSISLLSMANNKYVTAENNGTSPLIANRDAIGLWEKFGLEVQ